MKLLIAYDGSPSSEAAIDDLARAGLPTSGEALITSVAEVWLPPPGAILEESDKTTAYVEGVVTKHRVKSQRILNQAEIMVKHAASRVGRLLPQWKVADQATYGGPAWEILTVADDFEPDLIVVGAQGHSLIGRLLLGSVSQKIVTEATCSVRIARGRIEVDPAPSRILIGFDGSMGAEAAIAAVIERDWPAQTQVRLIAATDSAEPHSIGRFIKPPVSTRPTDTVGDDYHWLANRMRSAGRNLEEAGLIVSSGIIPGNPRNLLVTEAETWHADCIFVGANNDASPLSRFLLGSTSAAVAARAHCSVEVVRRDSSLS